jgi:hypothetical protein
MSVMEIEASLEEPAEQIRLESPTRVVKERINKMQRLRTVRRETKLRMMIEFQEEQKEQERYFKGPKYILGPKVIDIAKQSANENESDLIYEK